VHFKANTVCMPSTSTTQHIRMRGHTYAVMRVKMSIIFGAMIANAILFLTSSCSSMLQLDRTHDTAPRRVGSPSPKHPDDKM
jgi:hypothetical protein